MKNITLFAALWLPLTANGATIFNYTESQQGTNDIALGYPVPMPVDSLTPVDGFRTYAALKARHQQLAAQASFIDAQVVGNTVKGEDIWLYSVTGGSDRTLWGDEKGAVLINAGIHAREWQTPEAVTGLIEQLYERQDNQYLEQYLIENLNMHFVPVLNIDGFKQTQHYASKVTQSAEAPREGRMRRKNRLDTDGDINTSDDNLNGVDLNRNNNPFWAMTTSSSSDPTSLVYHGSSAASEPEILALQQAAQVAKTDRLRLFLDVHSFSQVYFTPLTGHTRRDQFTEQLMTTMRAANNMKYSYSPSTPGQGIGTVADHFAHTLEIPTATLETEPSPNGAADYGGNGISHDGFILPNSEVRRMVKETSHATLAGFYTVAQKPALSAVLIKDLQSGETVIQGQWQSDGPNKSLVFTKQQALVQNTNYEVTLVFNKPMRWLGDSGQVSHFPSTITTLNPKVQWYGKTTGGTILSIDIDTDNGSWQTTQANGVESGFRHYKTDSFSFNTNFGSSFDWQSLGRLALSVDTTDMVNQRLDANPATSADWQNGTWQGYENSSGQQLDSGGIDRSFRLIDDGSDLFETAGGNPTPTEPDGPSTNSSSGGGSFGWISVLLALGLVRLRASHRPKSLVLI